MVGRAARSGAGDGPLRAPRRPRSDVGRREHVHRRGGTMTVVVLHDLGDPAGGAEWRKVAPDDWIIPDLPGHGSTPPVRTGHYDPMSAVAIARWTLAGEADASSESLLVGVGHNAHGALV